MVLEKVAAKAVAQDEAAAEARLKKFYAMTEERIQEEKARRKRKGNCLFVFARVCKEWRKAQLKVGGPLRTWVWSHVLLPGSVALAKWALVEGCPRERGDGITMAAAAAQFGHMELVLWLIQELGFAMDRNVMGYAAGSGNLELVQWLRDEGCPWDCWTCYYAVDYGRVEVLRWLRENRCPWTAHIQDRAAEELGYTDDLGNLVVPMYM